MRSFASSLALFAVLNLFCGIVAGTASAADSVPAPVISEKDFDKVIVTRNADDVKGLTSLGEVSATSRMVFGDPATLRAKATVQLKKEAAKKGASIVLIQADNFAGTPINNVNLIGVAYVAPAKDGEGKQEVSAATPGIEAKKDTAPASATAVITEKDFEKVVVTRNADDVKGRISLGDVSATSRKVFGDPTVLRASATVKLKKEAAKKGASIVLIQADNFAGTPINNVNLLGVAYK
jgi:uncharacterized protein (DUF1810 family)